MSSLLKGREQRSTVIVHRKAAPSRAHGVSAEATNLCGGGRAPAWGGTLRRTWRAPHEGGPYLWLASISLMRDSSTSIANGFSMSAAPAASSSETASVFDV